MVFVLGKVRGSGQVVVGVFRAVFFFGVVSNVHVVHAIIPYFGVRFCFCPAGRGGLSFWKNFRVVEVY